VQYPIYPFVIVTLGAISCGKRSWSADRSRDTIGPSHSLALTGQKTCCFFPCSDVTRVVSFPCIAWPENMLRTPHSPRAAQQACPRWPLLLQRCYFASLHLAYAFALWLASCNVVHAMLACVGCCELVPMGLESQILWLTSMNWQSSLS
jgi:hypothetical protein